MRNITSIIFEGIPEKYLGLQFVVQGTGLGFVPYINHRLDDHYLELGYVIPALEELPSDYIDDQFHWGTQPIDQPGNDSTYLATMIDMIGSDNAMFASGLPHGVTDLPKTMLDRLGPFFRSEEFRAIMGGNATELYGL